MKTQAIAALILGVSASAVHAQSEPEFHFSGFGTAAVSSFTYKHADYIVDFAQPRGPGISNDLDAFVDSKLGLQASMKYGAVDFMVQGVARRWGESDVEGLLEWANVKWNITNDLYVRAGRIGHPFFMLSDYRMANYANLWVRPPTEVYGRVPYTYSDGVDAGYTINIGNASLALQGSVGRSAEIELNNGDPIELNGLWNLNANLDWGNWSFRVGYSRGDATYLPKSLLAFWSGLRATGFGAVASDYVIDNKKSVFQGVGFSYDPGKYVISGEYTKLDSPGYLRDSDGWYLSGGWRFNKVTPFVTISQFTSSGPETDARLARTPFNTTMNAILLGTIYDRDALAIGARWDIATNLALKGQIDFIKYDKRAKLVNQDASGKTPGNERLYTLSLDFVF